MSTTPVATPADADAAKRAADTPVAGPAGRSPADVPADVPVAGWTLRGRLARTFVVLGLVVVVILVLLILAALRFVGQGNDVIYRLQPGVSAAQRAYNDYLGEQAGLRSFLITGDDANLAPYRTSEVTRTADERELRRLIGDDASISDRVDSFDRAVARWRQGNAEPLIARKRAGLPVISGNQTAVKARSALVTTRATELVDALTHRAAAGRQSRVNTGIFAAVVLGVGVLVLIGAGLAFRRGLDRWVLKPVDGLAEQTRLVSSGELERRIVVAGPVELTDLGHDVETMRAQIVAELARAETATANLRQRSEELERSNADLQQFAYVASHDLSEPLRKVANFCQLLERQYADQLDDRARTYIAFAVDGAKRMQALISDLLSLSRVGRTTETFEPVSLDKRLDVAITDLGERIATSGAQVLRPGPLPTVSGDRNLLTALLENLVGNAIKYRRDDVAPEVTVTVSDTPVDGVWEFAVADNGIGIDPQYAEKIFAVFQRLHLRDQYGGTGIGLALCRRIVEFHGGHIWLDTVGTQSTSGSTFRFTLPEGESLDAQ